MLAPSVSQTSMRPLIVAICVLNSVTVSTLYWAQAVATLARLDATPSVWTSMMPSATLAGYAIGVAVLAAVARDLTSPNGLGFHTMLLGAALATAAVTTTAPVITMACLFVGIGCSLTQRALALATSAVPSAQRGPVIGYVIASGLLGIVAARALVPAASLELGWRTMFILDAGLICLAGVGAAIAAQRVNRRGWALEAAPLPSVRALWTREPVLRRAAMQQAGVFALFNFGWAVFPHALTHGSAVHAGAIMGVIASLGASAALVAGLTCRRHSPADVAGRGACAVLLAGCGGALAGGAGPTAYAAMALLDIGTQTALVANQAQAQALATSPAMRGRLAAIVTTVGFAAGALGAAIGNIVL